MAERVRQKLYAMVAEFDRPDALVDAARRAREKGYVRIEGFSPFPVEGLSEAIGFEDRAIAPAILAGAFLGALAGLGVQMWANAAFPLNIGGRPVQAFPAFALITFELMVLGAVCAGVLAMLLLNKLPRLHHPLFEIDGFHFATSDKFFLAILADDPRFDRAAVGRFLRGLQPVRVEVADEPEAAA
jgi:hypothetical protein